MAATTGLSMVESSPSLQVAVCYATPQTQVHLPLTVVAGSTIQQVIMQSGVLHDYTEIDLTICKVGIYGKLKTLDTVVRDQDRIEIYRPLIADPKESRRQRGAQRGRKGKVFPPQHADAEKLSSDS